MDEQENKKESFRINGEQIVSKIKELIKEGNIRKITIINKKNEVLFVIPLTWGVAGIILSPAFAALGTLAAIIGECTIMVERK